MTTTSTTTTDRADAERRVLAALAAMQDAIFSNSQSWEWEADTVASTAGLDRHTCALAIARLVRRGEVRKVVKRTATERQAKYGRWSDRAYYGLPFRTATPAPVAPMSDADAVASLRRACAALDADRAASESRLTTDRETWSEGLDLDAASDIADALGASDGAPASTASDVTCRCGDLVNSDTSPVAVRFVACPVHDDADRAAVGRALRASMARDVARTIDTADVLRVYSGRHGCACGCRGTYHEAGAQVTRVSRLVAAAPDARRMEGLGGEQVVYASTPTRTYTVYLRPDADVSAFPAD